MGRHFFTAVPFDTDGLRLMDYSRPEVGYLEGVRGNGYSIIGSVYKNKRGEASRLLFFILTVCRNNCYKPDPVMAVYWA